MNIVVVLALVGLASCHITFVEGQLRPNVEIEYSFDDEYGREVDVKIKPDRLRETSWPSLRKVFSPVVQYVNRDVLHHRPEGRTQFVAVKAPRPVFTQVMQRAQVTEAKPTQTTSLVQVGGPFSAPISDVSLYITGEHRPEPNTAYVLSEALPMVAPQPDITQYVAYEPIAAPPRPRVGTTYAQAEPAPVARPVISRNSFVNAAYNVPVAFQPVRHVIQAVAPVHVAHSQPHFKSFLVPDWSQTFREADDDDSGEK